MSAAMQRFDPAIPIGQLQEHPDNPRRGDDAAVDESVEVNGFFGAILVQQSTNRILAGHTRYRVMKKRGEQTIPGFWVDCDDDAARRILLVDNRANDLAYYDDGQLSKLLLEVGLEHGLAGTGYTQASIDLMIQSTSSNVDIVGNVRQGALPDEERQAYVEADIRSIILPYPSADYNAVVDGLAALRREWELDTNAAVVQRLVKENAPDAT